MDRKPVEKSAEEAREFAVRLLREYDASSVEIVLHRAHPIPHAGKDGQTFTVSVVKKDSRNA